MASHVRSERSAEKNNSARISRIQDSLHAHIMRSDQAGIDAVVVVVVVPNAAAQASLAKLEMHYRAPPLGDRSHLATAIY